jgi:hypothetical protein
VFDLWPVLRQEYLVDDVSFGGCLRGGCIWDGVPESVRHYFDDDVLVTAVA